MALNIHGIRRSYLTFECCQINEPEIPDLTIYHLQCKRSYSFTSADVQNEAVRPLPQAAKQQDFSQPMMEVQNTSQIATKSLINSRPRSLKLFRSYQNKNGMDVRKDVWVSVQTVCPKQNSFASCAWWNSSGINRCQVWIARWPLGSSSLRCSQTSWDSGLVLGLRTLISFL